MSRKMVKGNITIEVTEHIIIQNGWEYYVAKPDPENADFYKENPDYGFALVMGFETEMGDFYWPEITPYIVSRSKDLSELAPADGWHWSTLGVGVEEGG